MVGSWMMIFGGVFWWGFVVGFEVVGFEVVDLWWGFVAGFEVVDLSYHNRVSTTHYRFCYNRYPTQPVPPALTVWG